MNELLIVTFPLLIIAWISKQKLIKKVLLATLIIITGVKVVGGIDTLVDKHSIVEPAANDEESKNDKDEKKPGPEVYYSNPDVTSVIKATAMLASRLSHSSQYLSFTKKPATPPPNFI